MERIKFSYMRIYESTLYDLYLESTSKWDSPDDRRMVQGDFLRVLADFKALERNGEASRRNLHDDIDSHLGPRYGFDRASQTIYHRLDPEGFKALVTCAAGGEHGTRNIGMNDDA